MKLREDPQLFKGYLRKHPEDKLAWYLLGKEYLAKGAEGKAVYCFIQSAEVFDAFETADTPANARIRRAIAIAKEKQSVQPRFRRRLMGVAVLLIGLMLIPSREHTTDIQVPVRSAMDLTNDTAEPILFSHHYDFYYLPSEAPSSLRGEALLAMIGERRDPDKQHMLLAGTRTADGKWNMWRNELQLLVSVQTGSQGRAAVTYYDPLKCGCVPEDTSIYQPYIEQWKREQEETAVLRSAVAAYEVLNGTKPQQVEQLYKAYPHNVIGGVSPHMREMFAMDQSNGWVTEGSGSDASPNAENVILAGDDSLSRMAKPLSEPLSIVVDKAKHMLAVISGDIIIRSYPVGLGSDRTPEGEFVISEKVRDPNGKSNGDFGSRGMTLSDTLYAIHGTNKPDSIGKDESLGCIRMLREDVEELFDMVPLHTKVKIGVNVLPADGIAGSAEAAGKPFHLPPMAEERNPNKVYRWL